MIKAWVFEFGSALGRESPDYSDETLVQRAYDVNLARVASLEDIGFEGVFFSEHHFLNSLSPSPHLLIANVAARTKTLKLGVMGSVLAFHQPWRVAEELGMLDYLTNGRLEIGVAVGVPPEFLFVNIAQEDVRPMYRESLEYLDKALQSSVVSHEGRFWNFKNIPVSPRTKQVERRRKWMTIYSDSSCRFAAQRGYRVCTGFQSVENATKAFDAYRDEADKVGFEVGTADVAVRRTITLAETDAEAAAKMQELGPAEQARMAATFAPVTERLQRELGHGASGDVLKTGTMDAAAPRREGSSQSPDVFKLTTANPLASGLVSFEDEFIFGSPTTVAERIIDQCRRMGAGHILASHFASQTEAEADRHYKLWGKVIPILNKADLPGRRPDRR